MEGFLSLLWEVHNTRLWHKMCDLHRYGSRDPRHCEDEWSQAFALVHAVILESAGCGTKGKGKGGFFIPHF